MMLSVVMPVYNERQTVLESLAGVLAVDLPKEVIVVDDGSTDGSREILAGVKHPAVRLFLHEKNMGKGMAVRTGMARAKGEVILIQDADLEYDPNDYHAILAPFADPACQAVYGSRILKTDNPRGGWAFYLGGRLVTVATNLIFGSALTDEPTCYKAFSRGLLEGLKLQSQGFDLEPEITAKILKRGVKIHEVPISYRPRGTTEGKKIKAKDGLQAIWTLLRYRFKD